MELSPQEEERLGQAILYLIQTPQYKAFLRILDLKIKELQNQATVFDSAKWLTIVRTIQREAKIEVLRDLPNELREICHFETSSGK